MISTQKPAKLVTNHTGNMFSMASSANWADALNGLHIKYTAAVLLMGY